MRTLKETDTFDQAAVLYSRCTINLAEQSVEIRELPCRNLEDVLGGFARSYQLLAEREVREAYSDANPLIVNTGLLTGSNIMTGLRTYFSAYSPLKSSLQGLPSALWSAASGKFGSKLKWSGIDELVFEGRAAVPLYAVVSKGEDGPRVELKPAAHLCGLTTHQKIMTLQQEYADAHFAVIGPGGENYPSVFMGAVALSTENQLKSKEDKCRFAGRGGMGSLMGYKNLLAIVASVPDDLPKVSAEVRNINREILKGGGSAKFQPRTQGGGGGTWALYETMQEFHAVPENNFRPSGSAAVAGLFREEVVKSLDVKSEGCFRCGIRCHNNLYAKNADGSRGEFLAKFDFEPLNLFGTNLGIHDGSQVARLIQACDNLGMDAISLGTSIAYLLDYNARHPQQPRLNGATFGDFDKILELVRQVGSGDCPQLGQGLLRLSQKYGESAYAMQVKGLELPAYLPETNPGYPFAIAGGHMSMFTHMNLLREGITDLDYWVNAITRVGLYQVGHDMLGLCKFIGMGVDHTLIPEAISETTGLEIPSGEIVAAVRRAYLRGLALERKQGYVAADYTLPTQVFSGPNPNVKLPDFVTPEFFADLTVRVWEVFEPEMTGLLD